MTKRQERLRRWYATWGPFESEEALRDTAGRAESCNEEEQDWLVAWWRHDRTLVNQLDFQSSAASEAAGPDDSPPIGAGAADQPDVQEDTTMTEPTTELDTIEGGELELFTLDQRRAKAYAE